MTVQDVKPQRPWQKHYEPGVPYQLEYPDVPLHVFLSRSAEQYPARPALIFQGRVLTYRQLDHLTARFAGVLASLGVTKGDRVALLLPNVPQFVIAYYAALRLGAVAVPTNPLYVEREVEHQFTDAGAKVAVVLSRFYPLVRTVAARTSLEHVVVTSIKDYLPPLTKVLFTLFMERKEGDAVSLEPDGRTHWFAQAMARGTATAPAAEVRPDDLALLQYTGGTTGTAKGAMLTHRNLLSNVLQLKAWLASAQVPEHEPNVFMGVLPFFHIYGMATVMNFAVMTSATIVLQPRFEAKKVLEAVQRYRPNLFPGVPTMYMALINFPGVDAYNLRSVRACVSGAAPLPLEVQQHFEQLTGAKLVEGYGLTEASPVTHCTPIEGMRKLGSIGLPVPDTDARIVDLETGQRALPVGEAGELVVKGPQVMRGYWNREDETLAVLRDGWLHTGDIARMDEDGYFYIVDRKKDMIITGGMNVYPRDVEEQLYQHPKVREAVVVGLPDERWGEAVKAYIVLKEGEAVTEEELIVFCRERLAAYKVPKAIEFRAELPKSMVGKFLRRVLLEQEKERRTQA